MILEGIVTSLDQNGELNVAPMGPIVDAEFATLLLRPFRTSRTYQNLKSRPHGVFHVVDDVLLLARAAIGELWEDPETIPAERITGRVLSAACRWYEFVIETCDDSRERSEMRARIVHSGRLRDFFGFNRAKHAVLEGAILATRAHLVPPDELRSEFDRLQVIVNKTAGSREREAFELLEQYIRAAAERSAAERPEDIETVEDVTSREIVVTTGSRLHFGLFAHGRSGGRQFGGMGVMIDNPGFAIRARPAAVDELHCGRWAKRVTKLLSRLRLTSKSGAPLPALRLEIAHAPPAHVGLGSGTQLGMALATICSILGGEDEVPAVELARRAGRGLRSAVGLYGFRQGGLVVEAGKQTPDEISPLVARIDFPADWRFALVRPQGVTGLAGSEEMTGFARLAPMPESLTNRLCRLALTEVVPAAIEHDFEQASAAIGQFGRLVGEYFAPVQGGILADDRMRRLAEKVPSNLRGVGQTSWGPTLFILCPGADVARDLSADLAGDSAAADCEFTIAAPLNRGATVDLSRAARC
jgi:beta-RFAP synthase